MAINQDPGNYGVRAGQVVEVEGVKTRPFDPLRGISSVGLKNLKIALGTTPPNPASPVVATLRTLPEKEQSGLRIQITGIVREITRDELGRVQLAFADAGREVPITLSESKGAGPQWLDARVRIIGIGESSFNANGGLLGQHLWVQSSHDIQLEEKAPQTSPLYSIRGLYRDASVRAGHRIRIRGLIAARLDPTSVLLEDKWGAIRCELAEPSLPAVGTAVEISGFPNIDGLRIDLGHSLVTQIDAQEIHSPVDAGDTIRELTSVAAIRGLNPAQASAALPVRVTGVVTYNDPEWRHLFFQDASGGIYVKYSGSRISLTKGQKITIIGITNPGDFAPVIVAPKFFALGTGKLPRPIALMPRDAASGILDSQYVEIEGVIHPMRLGEETNHLTFELYTSFGQVHVYTGPKFADAPYLHTLEDARVRIRGVLATVFNSRRQLVGNNLSVSSTQDLQILEAAPRDPFGRTALPVINLLRFSPNADFSHRVKVQGSVTMIGRGFFYLQDDSGGVKVQGDTHEFQLADSVEALGYATVSGSYSPILTDATVRVVRHNAAVQAKTATPQHLSRGQFDSQLVSIAGHVLSVVDTLDGKILILQSGAVTFNARLEAPDSSGPVPELQEGSFVQLTGVCSAQVDPGKLYLLVLQDPVGFTLLLRSRQDVQVLEPPSWWTVQHALTVLGMVLAIMFVVLIWGTHLRRRVHMQTEALRTATQKEMAVRDLANAMQEVTLNKDFRARVPVRGADDIAQLGIGFNKMLSQLEQRDRAKCEAEAKLEYQALTDELTGLPNRRLLADRLAQTLALAGREKHMVAVLYVDLDGFKLVNDSFGHTTGDTLLSQVSERLGSRVRQSDTLARIGGDEFTVILSKLNTKEDAGLVGKNLLQAITTPFLIATHEITISASIGISLFPHNGTDGTSLLQQADSAMYAAKHNGKNQLMYFTPELGSSVRERINLEHQLRGAVTRGEIEVHYQPEFNVHTERLVRFEALARWNHCTLGAISPAKFIPIAEESGLIVPLGVYVLEKACREAVKWQAMADDPIQVAVNVSSLQFARETFVSEVTEVLQRTGLKPNLLQIELTESVTLNGAERASNTMKQLRALGITLAIDDFGTGYSCLSYLPRLPFNALKVDRSFVNELEIRPETKGMINSLVALAHNFDMQVIVEGVETPKQLELIRNLGANEVQGYLLGRPTPDPAFYISKQVQRINLKDLTQSGKLPDDVKRK